MGPARHDRFQALHELLSEMEDGKLKYALSALAGSLVSTSAVILSGHIPALLIGLGFVTGVLFYTWVLSILPKSFVISLFQSNNIRFQGRPRRFNLGGGDRRGGPGRISGESVPTTRAAMPGEAVSGPPERSSRSGQPGERREPSSGTEGWKPLALMYSGSVTDLKARTRESRNQRTNIE